MQRFRQMATLQKFAAVHSSVHNHFNRERHLYSRKNFKLNRAAGLTERRELSATSSSNAGRFAVILTMPLA
jgi:putative transposase